jgi:O-antigen/teichoic acid export membrane protein/glycosyltransferase involved in cell wall biosynthesis
VGGKLKLFIENFLIYGLGSIISSIIPFLMLPVITRLLKDTYYFGINDMFNVIVSFGSSLAVMGMFDAMFRMFFDKETEDFKQRVCSSALACVLSSGLVVFLLLVLFRSYFAGLFFNSKDLSVLLYVCAVTIYFRSLLPIVSAPTRMENKRQVFIAINTVSPLVGYAISIPMILRGNLLLALPLASMISSAVIVAIFTALNYKWFSLRKAELRIIKQLMVIGIPLLPTFLFYWIFSSFDRIMISKMIGTSFVGIYGVGAKVAGISQFIYLAFGGGWNYFTFSTMKDRDHTMTVSNVYEYLGMVSFACTIILTSISKLIFGVLFSGDYVYGSIVFPYLFLSPLVILLFQVAGSQFVVIKKTWPASLILSLGAAANISLTYLLIPLLGIEGAALGVITGYSVAAAGISLLAVKMRLLRINRRFLFSAAATFVYILVYRIVLGLWLIPSLVTGLGTVLWFVVMYKKDIAVLIDQINTKKVRTDKVVIRSRPLVSVVLSAYNHEKYIGECIESIIGQSYRNIELIILNDGSRDKTKEIIKRYRKACEKRFIRFIFIDKENEGLCKTANKGISIALGKYIVPFASDDVMLPSKVECSIKPMEEDNSVGMTFSNGYLFTDNSSKLRPFYRGNRKVRDGYIFQNLLRNNYLFAPSFCIRREAYDRVGRYNEKYSFEDYDMSLRISLKYKVKYVPYCLVKYRIHGASLSYRNDTQLNILMEHMNIIQKYRNVMRNKDFEYAKKDINRRILNCYFTAGNTEGFNQCFKKYRAGGGKSPVILIKKIWMSLGIGTRYYYKIKKLLKLGCFFEKICCNFNTYFRRRGR